MSLKWKIIVFLAIAVTITGMAFVTENDGNQKKSPPATVLQVPPETEVQTQQNIEIKQDIEDFRRYAVNFQEKNGAQVGINPQLVVDFNDAISGEEISLPFDPKSIGDKPAEWTGLSLEVQKKEKGLFVIVKKKKDLGYKTRIERPVKISIYTSDFDAKGYETVPSRIYDNKNIFDEKKVEQEVSERTLNPKEFQKFKNILKKAKFIAFTY